MLYADRLEDALARVGNPCLVGLDPHPDSLPEEFSAARSEGASRSEKARAIGDFCCTIVELAAGEVAAVKPQSAFFELFGADGAREWERVVACAKQAGLLVIGDVKRGDIDTTARAYARGLLEGVDALDRAHTCDAITINPYLGGDSIQPFLESCKKAEAGVYVLVRTSNKDSKLFQEHGSPLLYQRVADMVAQWGGELTGACGLSSVGAVVGATHPRELSELRARMPRTPLLLPGYGAQGAGAADIVGGFLAGGRGALVNSSRGILFAYKQPQYAGLHWKDAARQALTAMKTEIRAALKLA
ncbi:MAG: orotidine-5'-phosphate decarboxylase [Planctomycetes bacterium]|nr:orotidine-5'-phosphate decarboxylase [Planctomycetota bacterium]